MGIRQSLSVTACCCQPCRYAPSATCLDTTEEESSGTLDCAQITSLSVMSWGPGVSPAGKLFEETLQRLGQLEQYLLLFSSGANLSAVRWLIHLGASWDASDSNGTTCLHAACRSGSLSVAVEVIRNRRLIEAADVAGWAPLHIAAHMGRRKVVVQLLRARASPHNRNAMGQTPVHLCLDQGTREALSWAVRRGQSSRPNPRLLVAQLAATHHSDAMGEVEEDDEDIDDQSEIHSISHRGRFRVQRVDSGEKGTDEVSAAYRRSERPHLMRPACDFDSDDEEEEDRVGVPAQCEPELFFVTPAPVVKQIGLHRKAVMQLAVKMFNLNPCYGVAFSVATGVADNYTGAMKTLLRAPEVNRNRSGEFLGDALSVCHLIRFGVLDSMPLLHTSVITALTLAFRAFKLPSNLMKVHRLVNSVAVVWWRKHRTLTKEGLTISENGAKSCVDAGGDLAGLGLLQYLGSPDVLSQLMFSTVMLHWFMHGDVARNFKGRSISLQLWHCLNRGLEEAGADVPDFVQMQIFNRIAQSMFGIPELMCSPLGPLDLQAMARSQAAAAAAAAAAGAVVAAPFAAADAAAGPMPVAGNAGVQQITVEIIETSLSEEFLGADYGDLQRRQLGGETALHGLASMEGWIQLLGGAVPAHAKSHAADGTFGELTGATAIQHGDRAFLTAPEAPGPPSEGFVWASLCGIFLLFAVSPVADSPQAAPHAVLDARRLHILHADQESCRLSVEGLPMKGDLDLTQKIALALLLPDGRWREMCIDKLEFKTPSVEDLRQWQSHIERTQRSATCEM